MKEHHCVFCGLVGTEPKFTWLPLCPNCEVEVYTNDCGTCGGHGGYNVKVGSVEETFPCPECSTCDDTGIVGSVLEIGHYTCTDCDIWMEKRNIAKEAVE